MVIFKCKMCGGDLEIDEQMAVGTCGHCGSTMTLPKVSEEKVTSLFNRANHYRRNSEFDKAIKVYENILNEDNLNAEAYWGLVLCKYGIEYVEDPATGQRIPTCHRAQKTSIFLDVDYKQALEYADAPARQIYEAEAAAIDAIQKQILAISEQEEPYDIFICYKETSATGSRTKDSVLAQDIYHHLSEAGYKVFYSRISLEDKLGTAYEPYIFAALNSSPVMIVVATSTESVSAVWTKNEWSRYLALINKGEKKTLIPVYRDMDPYDLPEEFAHLQAQDMGRLGFMQDLVRGVKKIFDASMKPEQVSVSEQVSSSTGVSTHSLLKRAFICLEDGEWTKADEILELLLNVDPENARAYIGKLMAELQVFREEDLNQQSKTLTTQKYYQKALRFADEDYKRTINGYNQSILNHFEAFGHIETSCFSITYQNGNLPIGKVPIGYKVVAPEFRWNYREGANYSGSGMLKPITWLIVAKNHYPGMEPHVTLLSVELIGKHLFDYVPIMFDSYGRNEWQASGANKAKKGLRPWLNSNGIHSGMGFYSAFSDNFKNALLPTLLPNRAWNSGDTYMTTDVVFIPSVSEIGGATYDMPYETDPVYDYYRNANASRVATIGGNPQWYWTRSPASVDNSQVYYVNYEGEFHYSYATDNDGGIRPAINIKADTMVTLCN